MPLETLADTRSLLADGNSVTVYLGADNYADAVFDQVFDDGLEIGGKRSAVRLANVDADLVDIDAEIRVIDSYTDDPVSETDYYVREKQPGQRTTLLILEAV